MVFPYEFRPFATVVENLYEWPHVVGLSYLLFHWWTVMSNLISSKKKKKNIYVKFRLYRYKSYRIRSVTDALSREAMNFHIFVFHGNNYIWNLGNSIFTISIAQCHWLVAGDLNVDELSPIILTSQKRSLLWRKCRKILQLIIQLI